MKVTEIETHHVAIEYQDWIAYQLNHYYGPRRQTVYAVHTEDMDDEALQDALSGLDATVAQYRNDRLIE